MIGAPTFMARSMILQIFSACASLSEARERVDYSNPPREYQAVTKGDLVVNCPRVDLRFDHSPHLTWAKGSGGVTADVRGVHAEAPSAELDFTKQVLDLRGGVKLSRGQGWLTADTARIEIPTGKVSLTQVKGSIPVAKAP